MHIYDACNGYTIVKKCMLKCRLYLPLLLVGGQALGFCKAPF